MSDMGQQFSSKSSGNAKKCSNSEELDFPSRIYSILFIWDDLRWFVKEWWGGRDEMRENSQYVEMKKKK